jgi:hypothetical protein
MRRLFFSVLALSWLTIVGGCVCTQSQSCDQSGDQGCGRGCGGGLGRGSDRSWSHGVCDCELDEYCRMRSPWVRTAPAVLGTPVESIPAPMTPPAKALPRTSLE